MYPSPPESSPSRRSTTNDGSSQCQSVFGDADAPIVGELAQNQIYKAFREVGRVMRTMALLRFLADSGLRARVTAATNAEGWQVTAEDLAQLSPYLTSHILRFGAYATDELHTPPDVFVPALDEVDFGGEQPAAA